MSFSTRVLKGPATHCFLSTSSFSLLKMISYSVFSLKVRLSMWNWHSLQFRHAGHLRGSSVPMTSAGKNSGGLKSVVWQLSTLAEMGSRL